MTFTPEAPAPAHPFRLPPGGEDTAALRQALQHGVVVPALLPCTVLDFLVRELGIDPAYVEGRISTMFLDGQVVDAPDTACVRDGSRLALSAALPGLVGATLRKGGLLSGLRTGITHGADDVSAPATAPGAVTVKLFNLVLGELTVALLRHGFVLDPGQSAALLAELGLPPPAPGCRLQLTAEP